MARQESDAPVADARCYEFRVRGELGSSFLVNFESLKATVAPLETVIHGTLRDRAELHALLERLELYGIELVELHAALDDTHRRRRVSQSVTARERGPRRRRGPT